MRSRLLSRSSLAAVAALCLWPQRAEAHNSAHAALAVLGWDAQGASIVRLTRGLAYRSHDGFRYVCPEVWGGDIAAPASAIPDGPAVVAAEQLYLVESSGRISSHPSHEGAGIALARNRDALFGLFRRDGRVELRRISRDASELLHTFDEPFGLLAASESALAVLRVDERVLTVQRLSLQGEPRGRVSWGEASRISSAELRASGDELYVTLVHSAAPWLTLGRVTEERYEQLRSANSSFFGPLALPSGVLVVRDGALELIDGSRPLSQGSFVECLDAFDEIPYACVGDGLTALDGEGLGAPLFEMTSLLEPELADLSDAQRGACGMRWRDLRDHLVLEGRVSPEPGDAGAQGDEPAPEADEEATLSQPGACALRPTSDPIRGSGLLLLFVLLVRRRYSASEL